MSRYEPSSYNELNQRGLNLADFPRLAPETDDNGRWQRAIAATPSGGLLLATIPTTVSSVIQVNKNITVDGVAWSAVDGAAPNQYGAIVSVTTAAAQSGMASVFQVSVDYATLKNLVVKGTGQANGSAGIQVVGTSADFTHMVKIDHVFVSGFGDGITMDQYSDHVSVFRSEITNNNYGVSFKVQSQNDFLFEDCGLDGNNTASLHYPTNYTVNNVTCLRTHLGFSQYGITQDNTTTGDGAVGLTLIDSPIESVSVQHINLYNGGFIRIEGGYWTWNGTPANPGFVIGAVNIGPIWFNPRLQGTNANSPFAIKVNSYTNFPIYTDGKLNGFASAMLSVPAPISQGTAFRAYQNAQFTYGSAGAFAQVPFQTTEFDVYGDYSTTSNNFTVPISGFYQVNTKINLSAITTGSNRIILSFYKNGAEYLRISDDTAQANNPIIVGGSVMMRLNKGDTVGVFVNCSVNTTTAAGGAYNYFEVAKIG